MKEKKHSEELYDDAYYDQLIKQRIGEALRNQSKAEKLDLATLEAWVEADRQKRRARWKRGLAIACCFLIICFGTLGIKYAFDYDGTVAVAGKNDNKVSTSEKDAVVKGNGEDIDENVGVKTITCVSQRDLEPLKKQFSRLLEPHYVPEGYKFNKLTIEYSELMESYTFIYLKMNEKLEITQITGAATTIFNEYTRKLECDYGDLLIMEDQGTAAGCKIEDGIIYVFAKKCSDQEIIKIVNSLK